MNPESINTDLGIIAGNGRYPVLLAAGARSAGVKRLVIAGFKGETDPSLEKTADIYASMRVGQLGKLCDFFEKNKINRAIMAGQIAPSNLFNLRPDLKALLLLAKLKERNAESIFGAIAGELAAVGVTLLPAITYLEDSLAQPGHIAGPPPGKHTHLDIEFGFRIAKEVSRLDIGQTVVVKKGTVLAVEAFEGTDAALRRGGKLGGGGAVLVKVSKPNQDFRFDVPVIGIQTLDAAAESGIAVIACEAKKTLLLDKEQILEKARQKKITLVAVSE